MARNELASYMMRKRTSSTAEAEGSKDSEGFAGSNTVTTTARPLLPPPLDDEYKCSKCYVVDGCMLYRKVLYSSFCLCKLPTQPLHPLLLQAVDPPMPTHTIPVFALKTAHLTPAHCAFFKKWEALVSMEEQDVVRFRRELWTMGAEERERRGRCFGGMRMVGSVLGEAVGDVETGSDHRLDGARGVRYVYRFVRAGLSMRATGAGTGPGLAKKTTFDKRTASLLNGSISPGDAITLSIEPAVPGLIALARGFVVRLEEGFIDVGFEREVDLEGVVARTRRYADGGEGGGSGGGRGGNSTAAGTTGTTSGVTYAPQRNSIVCRLDKDEFGSGLGRIRDNLARLFYVNGDAKRRSLVVDLAPPSFDKDDKYHHHPAFDSPGSSLVLPGPKRGSDPPLPPHLNSTQHHALRKVLTARDYALILGMPGTGKTTTVAAIIDVLVGRGKTVLLASYTHSAVDSILMKLGGAGYRVLRLGSLDKVSEEGGGNNFSAVWGLSPISS